MSELAPLILPGTRSWATRNDSSRRSAPARVRGRDSNWKPRTPKPFGEEHWKQSTAYQRDLEQAKEVWNCLQFHYPGHLWGVKCNHFHGVLVITLPLFSSWQEMIKLKTLQSDPGFKCVVRAGGRFLERYDMPRAGIDFTHLMSAIGKFRPDFTYDHRPPD